VDRVIAAEFSFELVELVEEVSRHDQTNETEDVTD
jgi:hypothetical protein